MTEAILADDACGIADMARALASGRTSSEELARTALERIEQHNPVLNAVITVDADEVLETAVRADREIRDGRSRGPLHGIPIGIKDVIDIRGTRTSMGSTSCQDDIAARDATVVSRLRQAGAIIVGKLNTQEFAYGATGEASFHGPTRNPHDPDRITGGSSGGPAAAVASGMCAGALGTDTGGSIRIPSALCGVVGLKPTAGRISRAGVATLSWTLDHVGPITRSVADNALMLSVLCGHDPLDAASARRHSEDFTRDLPKAVLGLRIGVAQPYFANLDPRVRDGVEGALRIWEELGSTVRSVDIRGLDHVITAQRTVLSVEAYAALRHRYEERPLSFDPTVRQRLGHGSEVPGWQYAEARRSRDAATNAFDAALADVDVLVAPMVPITAPLLGQHETTDAGAPETVQSALTRLSGVTNFTGHPSLTMPCHNAGHGLPVGVQLIARRWDEATLYRFGQALEDAAPDH
ncbi:amidase [Streptomyces sp. NBC_01727]|uniref:amidase n=1 Tax=Streptomyces sp. NBC_01727 TaxID=2975924 RepID=UPI002E1444BE|nr:amidase [Streptomyces sp. NBC_01727]